MCRVGRSCCYPFLWSFAFFASLGPGLWLTALNVKYRDLRYVIPFIVQIGLYVSPVGYSSNIVPEQWRLFYSLNPVVGVIDGFRWCILGGQSGFIYRFPVEYRRHWLLSVAGNSSVPKDGKALCRSDLTANKKIDVRYRHLR